MSVTPYDVYEYVCNECGRTVHEDEITSTEAFDMHRCQDCQNEAEHEAACWRCGDYEAVAEAWSYTEHEWVRLCEHCIGQENPDKINWDDGDHYDRHADRR